MEQHLDPRSMEALSRKDLAATAYFRDHLSRPCELCEQFLSTAPGLDLLGGAADLLLTQLAPRAEAPLDEVGFARVQRAMRARERRSETPAILSGLAAGLALVIGLQYVAPAPHRDATDPLTQGIKATSPSLSLELAAATRAPDGRIVRADPGQTVAPEDVLLLRYHASEAGIAQLWRRRGHDGEPELLGTFPLQPGTHDLGAGDELLGIPLTEERGEVSFWLWGAPAGPAPDPVEVRAALRGTGSRPPIGLAGVRVRVLVREEEPPRP